MHARLGGWPGEVILVANKVPTGIVISSRLPKGKIASLKATVQDNRLPHFKQERSTLRKPGVQVGEPNVVGINSCGSELAAGLSQTFTQYTAPGGKVPPHPEAVSRKEPRQTNRELSFPRWLW